MPFQQEPHKLLMIPGPIEVADDVLFANAHPSVAHTSPQFVPVFGEAIKMIREVVDAPSAQPIVIAGSGTLGWDMAATNLLEPGDEVLVLTTGYFGDSFADCLATYGAKPTKLTAPVGAPSSLDEVAQALRSKSYKAITITHVDTSTGVLNDPESICRVVKEVSPDTLIILDGVCSVASEEIHMDAWGIDYVLFASQKGIGCPPGLSLSVASERAMRTLETRKTPPATFFGSWKRWVPVMQAYESGNVAYFATPPVQLIYALHASLKTITKGSVSLAERYQRHKDASKQVKEGIEALGLEQLAVPEARTTGVANGMTAVRYPPGMGAADILPKMAERGVVFGAGLHKACKDEYFRIGHMGVSVVDKERNDISTILHHLAEVLKENGFSK
ncbi:hypothetical protein MNAN1_000424 [Malassezia nana]|uniref:alanine--glyoxylate transaminase n=1 Tax=Malassezia nana TaxID=180528 RepID=A0AAF0J111_9BASI|nr:hypothetical protein MNAN1_000424 [Malassezia nana]